MRLRLGLVAGFAAGAYAATVAQRRNRQLHLSPSRQDQGRKATRSLGQSALDAAADRARAAVSLGVNRAKESLGAKLGDQGVRNLIQAPARLAAQQRNGRTAG